MRKFWWCLCFLIVWATGNFLYGAWTENGAKRGESVQSIVNGGTTGTTGLVSQSTDGSVLTITFPDTSTGAVAAINSATGGCVQVDGTGLTGSLAFTNETTTACGIYNGTNGVFWTKNETNYWLLFAL